MSETPGDALANLINLPWVESPFFDVILREKDLSEEERTLVQTYHDQGFLVLDDVLTGAECDEIVASVAELYDPAIPDGPRSRHRIQDAWVESKSVRNLATMPRILEVLRLFYGREPIPFQTLNFSAGTQQPAHSDLTHFSCYPERFMCGVWLALEDIDDDNGPLLYYVGSHRLPVFSFSDFGSSMHDERLVERYDAFLELLADQYKFEKFHAKKGQALIWSANLWHGGDAIRKEGATRHSQVTHYYFEDGFYFFPHNSTPQLGHYELKDIVNVATGAKVQHTFNQKELELVSIGNGRSFLAPRGEGIDLPSTGNAGTSDSGQ